MTTATDTPQAIASELYKSFRVGTRPDGSSFVKLSEEAQGAGDWRYDTMYLVHDNGDMMPDDYRYMWAMEAAEAFSEEDDWDEVEGSGRIEADIYTSDLTDWLGSHLWRTSYLTEAIQEYGSDLDGDRALMIAQCKEMAEVYQTVRQAIEDEHGRRDDD